MCLKNPLRSLSCREGLMSGSVCEDIAPSGEVLEVGWEKE